jgi:hypothetical protein
VWVIAGINDKQKMTDTRIDYGKESYFIKVTVPF